MGKLEVTKIRTEDQRLLKDVYREIVVSLEELSKQVEEVLRDTTLSPEKKRKYEEIQDNLPIVSAYIRKRESTAPENTPLYRIREGGTLSFVKAVESIPSRIKSEIRIDREIVREGEEELNGVGTRLLLGMSHTISEYITKRGEDGESTLFPNEDINTALQDTKEDYILSSRSNIISLLNALNILDKIDLPSLPEEERENIMETKKTRDEVIKPALLESLDSITGDLSLETLKQKYEWIAIVADRLLNYIFETEDGERIDSVKGRRVKLDFRLESPDSPISAISELAKIAKSKKSSQIQVPKDFWKAQINSVGDTLAYIQDDRVKKHIQTLQKKGKLLAGTLEGLSGGSAQLKVFTIALARTLNEQSKYYKTEEDWSGVPRKLIPEIMGEDITIDKQDPIRIKGESRPYPYILVSYEDMAKKMSKTGKISGGKDTEYIKDYIEELSGKEYLIDGGNQIIGVRFLSKLMTIYTKDRGTELGCLLQLSPQFSRTIGGYTGLRSDTIQLLGGGKQKEITMDLFALLIYNRGIPGNVYRVSKKEILSRYESKPTYRNTDGSIRRSKLEKDYRDSIEKIKGAKVITRYQEETAPGGTIYSIFTFSKLEYLKGEENSEEVDNQTGE